MKSIRLILSVAVVAAMATSCVEKSGKYQTLAAQRDSLLIVAQHYTQTLDILNEVETGFNSIGELESNIRMQVGNAEGQSLSKKQQMAAQVTLIKELIEENKAKIAKLQSQLVQSGRKNGMLAQTIERLEAELTTRTTSLEALQAELSKKNIRIEELTKTVEGLNTDVAKLNEVSGDQQKTITTQDQDMHRAWYVVATAKELKAARILSGNGLFQAKTIMDKEFDKSAFTQIDLRQLTEVPTDSRSPKLLSSHPDGSYEFVPQEEKLVTIRIVDPAQFWSVSKYLVIRK